MTTTTIEVRLPIELVDPDDAIVPTPYSDPAAAIEIQITPFLARDPGGGADRIAFRVEFEPGNAHRRDQPYRETMAPIFPNGWKHGDPIPQ